MSTRYNTGNPIESTDVRDMSDNAKNFDEFGNSTENSFIDRLGVTRKTIRGMNAEFDYQILNMGFARVGTFATGATLTNPRQVLLWDIADGGDGHEYGWTGVFPKIVPAGSTPLTTGGIAVGAWMSRFDPEMRGQVREALRRSYAEAGYNLVAGSFDQGFVLANANDVALHEGTGKCFSGPSGTYPAGTNPASPGFLDESGALLRLYLGVSKNLGELQANLASRSNALLTESIVVPSTGLSLPSYAKLEQQDGAIGFIGDTYRANKTIRKSGNATVTLTNQDPNAGHETVDAVMYQDPSWPSGGSVYPQKTTLRNVGIMGDSTTPNQAGFYVLQGGVLSIDSVDVVNCVNGLWAKDMFLSDVRKLHTLGKIRIDNGTSVTLTDCWAQGDVSRVGAFDFTGLKYSTLNSCASDHAVNTAYSFSSCQGIVLNACGCEGAATVTADSGTAVAVKDGNTLVINAFSCVPVASQGVALITVGSNNAVEISGWDSDYGQNHATDIYVYGNDSTVEIRNSKFYNKRKPVVQIKAGSTSKVIYHHYDGNTFIFTAPAVDGAPLVEAYNDSGTWTPVLTFGGANTGMAIASEGTWKKEGSTVTYAGRITLSAKGSSTGVALISGSNQFASLVDTSPSFALMSAIQGGVLSGTINRGANAIVLNVRGATGDLNASDANFTNSSTLWFSWSIVVTSSF